MVEPEVAKDTHCIRRVGWGGVDLEDWRQEQSAGKGCKEPGRPGGARATTADWGGLAARLGPQCPPGRLDPGVSSKPPWRRPWECGGRDALEPCSRRQAAPVLGGTQIGRSPKPRCKEKLVREDPCSNRDHDFRDKLRHHQAPAAPEVRGRAQRGGSPALVHYSCCLLERAPRRARQEPWGADP